MLELFSHEVCIFINIFFFVTYPIFSVYVYQQTFYLSKFAHLKKLKSDVIWIFAHIFK